MKSADIKPGVVYAWIQGSPSSSYARHERLKPVVFLVQPGKDSIWREAKRFGRKSSPDVPEFEKAKGTGVHQGSYHTSATGYPAVVGDRVTPELLAYAAKLSEHGVNFETFKAAPSRAVKVPGSDAHLVYDVFSWMTGVLGPWDEVVAQRAADEVAREQAQQEQAERKAALDARWAVVRTELGKVLGDGKPLDTYMVRSGTLHLGVEACEELVSVLQAAHDDLRNASGGTA